MNRHRLRIPTALSILLSVVLALPLWAHQQKEAITRLLFNERTGNVEVMHRFLIHDAEHATRRLFGQQTDLLGKAEDRERFAAYVHDRFTLKNQRAESIDLRPVGSEIEGEFIWVYAEAPIPENLTALTLSHQALRDLWPEQTNLVNVERRGSIQSAVFGPGSAEVTVELEEVPAP